MKHSKEEKSAARLRLIQQAISQHVETLEQEEKLFHKIKTITEITGNEAVTLSFLT